MQILIECKHFKNSIKSPRKRIFFLNILKGKAISKLLLADFILNGTSLNSLFGRKYFSEKSSNEEYLIAVTKKILMS